MIIRANQNKPIPFNPKLIEKMGGIANFAKERNRNFLGAIFFYVIDSRFRKLVHLAKWHREQLAEAKEHQPLIDTVKEIRNKSSDDDDFARRVTLWVQNNIKYVSDIKGRLKQIEDWQDAIITFSIKQGDCEDGAILTATMLEMGSINPNQIRLVTGDVYKENSTMNRHAINSGLEIGEFVPDTEGHCWCEYLCAFDAVPRIIDWCYWSNRKTIKNRPFYTMEKKYFTEWFSFNSIRYYGRYKNE